jgi:antitoxin FitA-like protein
MDRMRTTVDIPDPVYRRLKARAASEGRSAKALILRGVEQVLKEKPRTSSRRVTGPIVPSKRPGTLHLDNARIYEVISFP